MKVLFALGNAVLSENIAKQYYTLYGEKIEYKDVFYFKALLEEVKRDKTYDRIVIAEQLEPPQRNLINEIDQMIFSNIDIITDEIEDSTIIFICSDGRTKEDSLIGRLFNIGIYNLLMGDEREMVPLCKMIKNPRNKKEAKEYLKSNPAIGDAAIPGTSDEEVAPEEIMNISSFFNNLRTPEEYLKNFAIVEEQYNEKQLQIIALSLRQNLKKGEEIYSTLYMDPRFSKYCPLSMDREVAAKKVENAGKPGILGFLSGKKMRANSNSGLEQSINKAKANETNLIEKMSDNNNIITNTIAAGAYVVDKATDNLASKASAEAESMMDKSQQEAKALAEQLKRESEERRRQENELRAQQEAQLKAQQEAQLKAQQEARLKAQQEAQLRAQQEAQLRAQQEAQLRAQQEAQLRAQQEAQLRAQQEAQLRAQQEAQLRAQQEAQLRAQQEAQLKAQQEAQIKTQQEAQLKAQQEAQLRAQQEAQLRAQQEAQLKAQQEAQLRIQQQEQLRMQQEAQLKAQQEELQKQREALLKEQKANQVPNVYTQPQETNPSYSTPTYSQPTASTTNSFVVPADYKKVVAFVGTNKAGTSFIVNSIANLMAMKGVKTSILDMTKNRGMYWFYNDAAYKKSDIVSTCMSNLSTGVASPISVGKYKNLTLYTTIPGGREDNRKSYKHRNVIETAKKNCNLLLIDCDFTTPHEYLEQASEVYIVQDLDLIKVQETIEFFRELKTRRMDWSKLTLVMNNWVKSKVTTKKILKNALTYYNDPTMTFTEEFDEIKKFIEIPLDIQNYSNYIESMQDGKLNYEKYTPELKNALEVLSTMVYGVTNNTKRRGLFG